MKWEVWITESEEYLLEIEAENQLEAEAKAHQIMEDDELKISYHNDSNAECRSEEI